MIVTYPIVGIDIGKHMLDGSILDARGRSEPFSLASEKGSLRKLAKKLKALGTGLVVLEATGGYEVPVMAALAAEGVPFARVNPSRVRHFAKGMNFLAKTDKIDAKVLALFGERARPKVTVMPGEKELQFKALILRRQQLVELRKMEKTRRHQATNEGIAKSIGRAILFLAGEIKAVEAAIEVLLADMPEVATRRDLADSVPGIAATIANIIVANLPELGILSTPKLKKLVGVAPLNDDSADRSGARHIRGGARWSARRSSWPPNPVTATIPR